MVRRLSAKDFRSRRFRLEAKDFALTDGRKLSKPTDLISKKAWKGIMALPDDAAITTTSFQGSRIELLYDLWGGWIENFLDGTIGEAMLDCADDFAAAILNLSHGFYKQAIFSLRNSLEVTVTACRCTAANSSEGWLEWKSGKQIAFRNEREKLSCFPVLTRFEQEAIALTGKSILSLSDRPKDQGWLADLYHRLCKFSHARGDSSNASFWKSNGPIYDADGMRACYQFYLETYVLLLALIKLTRSDLNVPVEAHVLFKQESLREFLDPCHLPLCRFYASKLLTI